MFGGGGRVLVVHACVWLEYVRVRVRVCVSVSTAHHTWVW